MKMKIILLLIAIIIIIIAIYLIKNKKTPKVELSNIKSFHFSYTTGYAIDTNVRYEFEYKEDKYIAIIKPNNMPEEELLETELNSETIDKINTILEKYNVTKWDGFHKIDKNVLDGNSFSLSIHMANDQSISASGYMRYPENYGSVRTELDDIFMDIYNKRR